MAGLEIELVPILGDNYCVVLHDPATGATACTDPGEAAPLKAAADARGWRIDTILITHHHADHTAELGELKAMTGARVIGPKAESDKIAGLDQTVQEGDSIQIGNAQAQIIETPGHTLGHIVYYFAGADILLSGDSLFALGCGRLFEGSPAQMWGYLKVLRDLPPATQIYCGHEYTLGNARFAVSVDPENTALQEYAALVEHLRNDQTPTVPTTMGHEQMCNPFFKADDPAMMARLGMSGADPVDVFAEIRKRKDQF